MRGGWLELITIWVTCSVIAVVDLWLSVSPVTAGVCVCVCGQAFVENQQCVDVKVCVCVKQSCFVRGAKEGSAGSKLLVTNAAYVLS